MTILSVAVCTKAGKTLVSRQFVPLAKIRVESLLAAFPKLLEAGSQHTFIETEGVRYVYQPIEQLYMVLITTKNSNILEDLDTLRLLVKLIPEYCHGNTEEQVSEFSFDLIFAIDEVISIGYRETVTLSQVRQYTEMDSHEEKLQKIIMDSKVSETREAARRKAEAIDKKKAEMKRAMGGLGGHGGAVSSSGFGGGGGGGGGGFGSDDYESGGSSFGGGRGGSSSSTSGGGGGGGWATPSTSAPAGGSAGGAGGWNAPAAKAAEPKKTISRMKLGKAKTSDDFVNALVREEHLPTGSAMPAGGPPIVVGGMGSAAAQEPIPVHHENVHVSVVEQMTLVLNRDGGVNKLEVKGEMKVCVFDPDQARVVVRTNGPLSKADGFQSRLHPKIDKKAWESDGVVQLKDQSSRLPMGADNAPSVLKWRFVSTDEDQIPMSINFWPNEENGRSMVSVELAAVRPGLVLRDVYITVPCQSREAPQVSENDGDFVLDPKECTLIWHIPEISDDNDTANLEFSVPEVDPNSFYPLNISFSSNTTFSGLEPHSVSIVDGDEIEYTSEVQLAAARFSVE